MRTEGREVVVTVWDFGQYSFGLYKDELEELKRVIFGQNEYRADSTNILCDCLRKNACNTGGKQG